MIEIYMAAIVSLLIVLYLQARRTARDIRRRRALDPDPERRHIVLLPRSGKS